MNQKTTNYYNTFIEIADDCPVQKGEIPPIKNHKTAANIQYELISMYPYKFTSDDVLFEVYANKHNIHDILLSEEREKFFSKGQPCMRSSPLCKRYGWGVHSNEEGKIALYAAGSNQYKAFVHDKNLKQIKAMRSNKK